VIVREINTVGGSVEARLRIRTPKESSAVPREVGVICVRRVDICCHRVDRARVSTHARKRAPDIHGRGPEFAVMYLDLLQ
jgi:hypothetical protein